MEKYIIGIGDSWTHGEGAWPEHILKKYNYQVQYYKHRRQPPLEAEEHEELERIEREHGWLSQLGNITGYTTINLGMPGRGNHSAVRNLRFLDKDLDLSHSIIILMLTHSSRLDIFRDYSGYERWFTAHPRDPNNFDHTNMEECFGAAYSVFCFNAGYSSEMQTLLDILEAQDFAVARGAKLIVCNGFNDTEIKINSEHNNILKDNINWSQWMHDYTDYNSFIELLVQKENLEEHTWRKYLQSLDKPSKFLTNCQGAHPTIEGHTVIAEELAELINTINKNQES